MNEDYVSFKTAKLLKEKGFDEVCRFVIWDEEIYGKRCEEFRYCQNSKFNTPFEPQGASCTRPTQALVLKWLREKHNIYIQPQMGFHGRGIRVGKIPCSDISYNNGVRGKFNKWEDAIEAAIKHCLEYLIK